MNASPERTLETPAAGHDRVLLWLDRIDVYLLDQVMKRRLRPGMSLLDAGCGGGRNLGFFLRSGYEVFGVDEEASAVAAVRARAAELAPRLPAENFRAEPVEATSFADAAFDAVIANAVLHFARDEAHFGAMLDECRRVLRPGGLFFARLASSIGIEDRVRPIGGRRHRLPDGTERFLVDEATLIAETERFGGRLVEPIKTVNVQGARCMTTWCLTKEAGA
jgi:SAM-dependent methyltransferase